MVVTIGVDEAGRGCWAGPLVAAAVYFPADPDKHLAGLNDSKQLSATQRERLFVLISDQAQIGVGWASPRLIDDQGLTAAQVRAMSQALANLPDRPDHSRIIVDGSVNYLAGTPGSYCQPRADSTVAAVMAASIVAKVSRDRFCRLLDRLYPNWGLADHKGYGTAKHRLQLTRQAPITGLHRLSYRPVAAAYQTLARSVGDR